VTKNRRRSTSPETEPTPAETESVPPSAAPKRPKVGLLSGQLPPDAVRGSGKITTEAGHYLRAAARDDTPARYGLPPGEVDEAARQVWKIAFGLLVRRRFDRESSLAEISRTVAAATHEHALTGLHPLDAEMLVRDALGEQVPLDGIESPVLVAVHLLLSATLADELALGNGELDAVVAQAEEKAATLIAA
jgi:hypothetical protein